MRTDIKSTQGEAKCSFGIVFTTIVLILAASITILALGWSESNVTAEKQGRMAIIEKGMTIQLGNLKMEKVRLGESIKTTKLLNEDMVETIAEGEKKVKDLEGQLEKSKGDKEYASGRLTALNAKLRKSRRAVGEVDYDLWKMRRTAERAQMHNMQNK